MMENLFKWVNCVMPTRYLNKFSKNVQPRKIMFNLTHDNIIPESPVRYDLSILSIVMLKRTHVCEWRLDDKKFV